MKKIIYIFSAAIFCITALSCEEELTIYNGESYAQLNGADGSMRINPSEDTENIYFVGVTETSGSDRSFTISIDEESTLDPSYYEIESLTGIIPAGEFVGEIKITTYATLDFPPSDAQLILNLESVEDTEIINSGVTTKVLGTLVACAFEVSASIGTYGLTQDDFGTVLAGDGTFTVEAGPEENQITLVNPFGHNTEYRLVVDVDPNTGEATVDEQNVFNAADLGYPENYGEGFVEGSGFVFSCLESIQFDFTYCVEIGCFGGTWAVAAEKL